MLIHALAGRAPRLAAAAMAADTGATA